MTSPSTHPFDFIAFDADDTLWHSETLFNHIQERYKALLAPYHDAAWIEDRLYQTEIRNLRYFGYGVKGFTLSMIETAIELTEGRIGGAEIQQILDFAREMLDAPVQVLPGVEAVLRQLGESQRLMVITKGDLLDQEAKLARSGLANFFDAVEIVSDKTVEAYQAIFNRHAIRPGRFLMVGNSIKSDILPVLNVGGQAVHIPYHITWTYEIATVPGVKREGFTELADISELPAFLATKGNT